MKRDLYTNEKRPMNISKVTYSIYLYVAAYACMPIHTYACMNLQQKKKKLNT